MVVVDHVTKLFLEREWLEVFPCLVLRFENIYSVLKLIDFLRLARYKLLVLLHHATKNHDVVLVEAECEVISDLLRHFDIKNSPDAKLGIVALNRV